MLRLCQHGQLESSLLDGACNAGLNAWAAALRRELRGAGVRVVNVSLLLVTQTFTGTGMYEQMLLDLRKAGGGVPPRVPRLHGL